MSVMHTQKLAQKAKAFDSFKNTVYVHGGVGKCTILELEVLEYQMIKGISTIN